MRYCFDIFVKKPRRFMKRYNFRMVTATGNSCYYTAKVDKEDKRKLERKLAFRGLKYRCYEECWSRSSDYRRKYLKNNPGPYYCRYCNRKLKTENMVVDHIIPVAMVKENRRHARFLLKLRHIEDVNDERNLATSCKKCNDAKRDKMGIWLIKAWIGNHQLYWSIRPFVIFSFWILILLILYRYGILYQVYKFSTLSIKVFLVRLRGGV